MFSGRMLAFLGMVAAISLLALARPPDVLAQGGQLKLAPGRMLVAVEGLSDPNFAETVVLLTQYTEEGALGLVLNQRSELPLSRVLRKLPAAKDRGDPVYLGGPVEKTGVLALLRSQSKPDDSMPVFGDVYIVSSRPMLEKMLESNVKANQFHVYLGYAGWGPGQLEREIQLGGWHVMPGEAAAVFDPEPESLWARVVSRAELKIAGFGGLRGWREIAAYFPVDSTFSAP